MKRIHMKAHSFSIQLLISLFKKNNSFEKINEHILSFYLLFSVFSIFVIMINFISIQNPYINNIFTLVASFFTLVYLYFNRLKSYKNTLFFLNTLSTLSLNENISQDRYFEIYKSIDQINHMDDKIKKTIKKRLICLS